MPQGSFQNTRLHHTPGYGGFVPQIKYQIGRTYGATTTELLDDSSVAKSKSSVLSSTTKHAQDQGQPQQASKASQLIGDVKLTSPMTPGYTGYIPRMQHHFGRRYAEASEFAIVDHENAVVKQNEIESKFNQIDLIQRNLAKKGDVQPGLESAAKYTTPLRPIAKDARPYRSKNMVDFSMSPLFMPEGHPGKFYACGYTGYIPRHREELGKSYRDTTQSALRVFATDQKRLAGLKDKPVVVNKPRDTVVSRAPQKSRVVPPPGYTGFIPGKELGVVCPQP